MSAPAHADTEITRRAAESLYAAGANLDLDAFLAVLDENAQVHEPGCLPYGGTYTGHGEIQELFGKVNEHLDLTSIRVEGLVAQGDQAVATVRITARASGEELVAQERHTILDGKIADLRIFFFDPTLVTKEAA